MAYGLPGRRSCRLHAQRRSCHSCSSVAPWLELFDACVVGKAMTEDDFMLHQIREEQKVRFMEIMAWVDRRLVMMGSIFGKKPEDHT
jgi:hypothetical protein